MRCALWREKVLAGTSFDSPGLAATRHASTTIAALRCVWQRVTPSSSEYFHALADQRNTSHSAVQVETTLNALDA